MNGPREPRTQLAAEAYWAARHGINSVRPELRPMVEQHAEQMRRVIEAERKRLGDAA